MAVVSKEKNVSVVNKPNSMFPKIKTQMEMVNEN